MLSHVTHGSVSHAQAPQESVSNAASDKGDEDAITDNSTMMPTRSQPEAASETIPSTTYQCHEEVPRLLSKIDGEQLLPSIFLDAVLTSEDHGTEQDLSLDPSGQCGQTPVDLDVSYLLGSLSDVRSLPGIWTHEYQMGPASFQAQSPSADKIIQCRSNSNSSFSDHMHMIRGCLKMQWRKATQIRTDMETPYVILRSLPLWDELTWGSGTDFGFLQP